MTEPTTRSAEGVKIRGKYKHIAGIAYAGASDAKTEDHEFTRSELRTMIESKQINGIPVYDNHDYDNDGVVGVVTSAILDDATGDLRCEMYIGGNDRADAVIDKLATKEYRDLSLAHCTNFARRRRWPAEVSICM